MELRHGQRVDRATEPLVPGRGSSADGPAHARLRPRRRRSVPSPAARRRVDPRPLSARAPDSCMSSFATVGGALRLFPIVEGDVCYPVAALLARGKLDEAARLVPERAWVASTPLYG